MMVGGGAPQGGENVEHVNGLPSTLIEARAR